MNDELNPSTENKESLLKSDSEWASDVPYLTLEDRIDETQKASREAFKPLSESGNESSEKSDKSKKSRKKQKSPSLKKGRRNFIIFLAVWLSTLIIVVAGGLLYFYRFLENYEAVYQDSLPYHTMDSFMTIFDGDTSGIYNSITNKPKTTDYETKDNVIGYISTLLEGKEFEYQEATESTDKIPVYNITADGYIIGKMTLKQSPIKREYDLPYYEEGTFEFYTDPGRSISVKVPETCQVYLNDVLISPGTLYQVDTVKIPYFEDYTTLPVMKSYKVSNLYEEPKLTIISSYGEELNPEFNSSTGVYEVPYCVSSETEEEMLEFAKSAVKTYTQVITREVDNSSLYGIFTKDNEIVKSIIANDSSFKWFPNHKTTDIEDEIIEFTPYNEDAFYCEIKHTQHMLIYGVRPSDEVTDTRFYYVRENGNWKICHISY